MRKHNIYSVDQYQRIVMECRNRNKCVITRMADTMFELKKKVEMLGLMLKGCAKNTEGEAVDFFRKNVCWISLNDFGIMKYKENLDSA